MSLNYEFKKALSFISRLPPEDRNALSSICKDIRQAEDDLNERAESLLQKCITACTGICCRNIRLDDIIGFYDFTYILATENGLKDDMAACLRDETLYSADCIFLKNGTGPCIFPSNARPRICITTFCFDDTPAKKEIRRVNQQFNRLSRFIFSRRLKAIKRLFH